MPKKNKVPAAPRKVDFGLLKADLSFRTPEAVPGHELGHITYQSAQIFIQNNLQNDFEKEVVLHECLHGIINYNEVLSEEIKRYEEDIVKALSPALLRFLRDNPKLLAYLLS